MRTVPAVQINFLRCAGLRFSPQTTSKGRGPDSRSILPVSVVLCLPSLELDTSYGIRRESEGVAGGSGPGWMAGVSSLLKVVQTQVG